MMNLVRIPTAAKQLGLTRQRIHQLIDSKEIQVITIDSTDFIDLDTLTYTRKRKPKQSRKSVTKNSLTVVK